LSAHLVSLCHAAPWLSGDWYTCYKCNAMANPKAPGAKTSKRTPKAQRKRQRGDSGAAKAGRVTPHANNRAATKPNKKAKRAAAKEKHAAVDALRDTSTTANADTVR
jgi:hypothetical protein